MRVNEIYIRPQCVLLMRVYVLQTTTYIHVDLYLRIARQQSIGAQVDFIEGDEENIQVLMTV